jgi:hypothetical protein
LKWQNLKADIFQKIKMDKKRDLKPVTEVIPGALMQKELCGYDSPEFLMAVTNFIISHNREFIFSLASAVLSGKQGSLPLPSYHIEVNPDRFLKLGEEIERDDGSNSYGVQAVNKEFEWSSEFHVEGLNMEWFGPFMWHRMLGNKPQYSIEKLNKAILKTEEFNVEVDRDRKSEEFKVTLKEPKEGLGELEELLETFSFNKKGEEITIPKKDFKDYLHGILSEENIAEWKYKEPQIILYSQEDLFVLGSERNAMWFKGTELVKAIPYALRVLDVQYNEELKIEIRNPVVQL